MCHLPEFPRSTDGGFIEGSAPRGGRLAGRRRFSPSTNGGFVEGARANALSATAGGSFHHQQMVASLRRGISTGDNTGSGATMNRCWRQRETLVRRSRSYEKQTRFHHQKMIASWIARYIMGMGDIWGANAIKRIWWLYWGRGSRQDSTRNCRRVVTVDGW
mgnify:CR=1 FL=1